MPLTDEPLRSLTAADLMSRDVVAISQEMSLRAAAHLLSRAGISGAPVVDDEGRCVGVLSTTDFMRWSEKGCPAVLAAADPYFGDWGVDCPASRTVDRVKKYMTADPVTASPATPVLRLARMMTDAHIHRVIVTDGQRRPLGVVSSTDILAAVACADTGRRPAGRPAASTGAGPEGGEADPSPKRPSKT
jgi:CBS domain-containing protein